MRHVLPILLSLLLTACATTQEPAVPTEVTPFSRNWPGQAPRGWQAFLITRTKARTEYETVVDPATGRVVLAARAIRSASGLTQRLDIDPAARPRVAWEWRVVQSIPDADNTDRDREDAPARLLMFFDGDHSRLPAREQMRMEMAQLASGRRMPYATLMYIWENRQPVGTVIDSAHTGRVKMVVAGSGVDRLGQWKRFERDYVEDFRRAFGETPGRLIGVGVLTDTDNTGGTVEAYYGDIALLPPHQARAASAGASLD
ncbi:MAG: DUF3047 domain-containing protein [Burkholderiaceae bacterium]|nr:DUF3047 domain-containing protein [Burkholderiaceae bacterium]